MFDGHTFSVVATHGRFDGERVVIGVYKYRADVDIPACGGMHVALESPYRTVRKERRKESERANGPHFELSGSKPSAPEKILRPSTRTSLDRNICVDHDAEPRSSSDCMWMFWASAMHTAFPAKPLASTVPPLPPI